MSNYYMINGQCCSEDELYHYGVKGMRWGVRRASKRLSGATSGEGRDKAVASLQKHRTKGSAAVDKLKKRNVKLTQKSEQQTIKNETKAASIRAKAAKKRDKMYGFFTSEKKAQKLEFKAKKLDAKAAKLETKAAKVKAKLAKNETMIKAFEREISNIDRALAGAGKRYLED